MNLGWIKLHRKLLDNWVSQEPELLATWIRLLLEANHKDVKRMFNGCMVEIKRGQLIFGLNAFCSKSGISESKVRRYISMLESGGMIIRQKTNKYSIISIVNFEMHQHDDRQEAGKHQANNNQTSGKQQHLKNDNTVENAENDLLGSASEPATPKKRAKKKPLTDFPADFFVSDEMIAWFCEQGFHPNFDIQSQTISWKDGVTSKGLRYADWKAAWRNGMKLRHEWFMERVNR